MNDPWPEVEAALDRTVTAEQRNYLERKVGEPLVPEVYAADLIDEARELFGLFQASVKMRSEGELPVPGATPSQWRHWAVSEILALEAASDTEIADFRAENLPEGLLAWADIELWLEARKRDDGPIERNLDATWLATGLSDNGCPPRRRPHSSRIWVATLAYAVPDGSFQQVISVNELGQLGRLRRLSERAADFYTWQPAQACVFILTGLTPQTRALRTTVDDLSYARRQMTPWRRRVTMEIDVTVDPHEVMRAFIDARRRAVRDPTGSKKRTRLLSERTYRLAVHSASRSEAETWRETMQAWDAKHPEWAYAARADAVRQFRRESQRAIDRTLDPLT